MRRAAWLRTWLLFWVVPWVVLRAALQVLWGLLQMLLYYPHERKAQQAARAQRWARGMLRIFGVQVQVHGQPAQQGPLLVVANHISWLDILVLLAVAPVHFIARQENAHWPVLGYMTRMAGTVFVERASARDMARVVAHITQVLRDSTSIIAVFPEGQTSTGASVQTFHGNMLQAAIDAGVPVQALALDYRLAQADGSAGARTTAVTYATPLNLQQSLRNTLAAGRVIAQVHCAQPVTTQGANRRTLAADLRSRILQLRGDEA